MPEDWYNSVSVCRWHPGISQILCSSQRRWAENGTITTDTGVSAESGKVPAGGHSRIYTSWSGIQHTGYHFVTTLGEGHSDKDSGNQSGLIPYIQRSDEVVGFDKFCQHGTTTGKITLLSLTALAQEDLQDSCQPVQDVEAQVGGNSSPCIGDAPSSCNKNQYEDPQQEGVTTDCSKKGYGGHMNNLSFRGRWPAKKERNTHINILELETL